MSATGCRRDVRQITSGVYSLCQKDGGYVHAYLFDHRGELTLVDTMWDADASVLIELLGRLGRSPADLKHIAVTHAHRSHLGGLATLKLISGATVYAHGWEADIIAAQRQAQPVPLRPLCPLGIYKFRLGLALGVKPHRPCEVDEWINHEAPVGPLTAVHIPGHTPGHLGFYWEERGVLVAGDALATWPRLGAGWPGFNLNEPQHRASVRKLTRYRVDFVGVGHGDPITKGAQERLAELALS
jgi:glyoxylase-like metal-dependent hydrolase (beta-lactamase superfamily II)